MRETHTIDCAHYFSRLDKYLLHLYPDIQRSSLFALIRKKEVRVNGVVVRDPSFALQVGDEVSIFLPQNTQQAQRIQRNLEGKRRLRPEKQSLRIIYEDETLLAISKPPGISIHPGEGERNRSTLIEGLMFYGEEKGFAPFLVHRLDRQTSGVLLVAKDRPFSRVFSEMIRNRQLDKTYWVLVSGEPPEFVEITDDIEGKAALTRLRAVKSFDSPVGALSLCEVSIETGRKHQIRVHLAGRGWPVMGDERYGDFEKNRILKKFGLNRMFLHCWRIQFSLPDRKPMKLEAPLWEDLRIFLDRCDERGFS